MVSLLEIFLSAILGDLTTRCIDFLASKRPNKPPALDDVEDRLCRVLLRAHVIVDEAMGRRVTNQAMLWQLDALTDTVHRGYYALDTFRSCQHPYSFSQTAQLQEQLQGALDRLSSMIADVNELVILLATYPRLCRQPYSMHILLSNCMFGRQVEAELVIKFLLHKQPHNFQELGVLPIVGPPRVGKSTLVAHVCKDEKVQDYFSEILWLNDLDFTYDKFAFRQGYVMKHRNEVSGSNKGKRLLVVIELSGNVNEDAWNMFYLASKQRFCSRSKIIITSRSDRVAKFGTTQALTLKHLSHEAYWYFFKTLTFGSMDSETHPRFAQLAMEIARTQNRSIIAAYTTSYLLRKNFDIHFWCKFLSFWRGCIQKHVSKFGKHPLDLLHQNRPVQIKRMATPEYFIVCRKYHCSSQEEVPKIRVEDVLYGSMKTDEKFEVLVWTSHIPPYYSYADTFEIQEPKTSGAKRKRSMKHGTTSC